MSVSSIPTTAAPAKAKENESNARSKRLNKVCVSSKLLVIRENCRHYSAVNLFQQEKKTLFTVGLLLGGFLLCWSPLGVIFLYTAMSDLELSSGSWFSQIVARCFFSCGERT